MPPEESAAVAFEWSPFHLLIVAVILQRLWELRVSKRNEEYLHTHDAIEFGRAHYPALITLHVLWFGFMIGEIFVLQRQVSEYWWAFLTVYLMAEGLRQWAMQTLGHHWTSRILIIPNSSAITGGPYKYFRHPNYIAVAIEFLALPLMFSAILTAATATSTGAILAFIRIRKENKALRQLMTGYSEVGARSIFRRKKKTKPEPTA